MPRNTKFKEAAALGYSFDGEIKIGGIFLPLIREATSSSSAARFRASAKRWWSLAPPGTRSILHGPQLAAKICVMRALALLQRSLGSLDRVKAIPGISIFV